MAKLALKAEPTFKAKVNVPVAGGVSVPVEMTFKHRTKKELEAFIASRKEKTDTETFMSMVEGWELDEPFTAENVELMLEHRMGSGLAAYMVYIDELIKAKSGN